MPFLGQVPLQTHPFLGKICGIVMEKADTNLSKHLLQLRSHGSEVEPQLLWGHIIDLVGQDIADGLGLLHGHKLQIIHRDIYEDNILMRGNQAMIGDLGMGKALRRDAAGHLHTKEPGMVLTIPPEAMGCDDDPEQTYDCSYDIYGLGLLLAKMALCASLPDTEWQAQSSRIMQGPFAERNF